MKYSPSLRSIIALSLTIFFISDIEGGIGPILAVYLRSHLAWDTNQVGIALASAALTSALFQIPSGLIVDATHFKRLLLGMACGLIILSCYIILRFPSLYPIITAQSIMGIAIALIPPSIAAITLGLVDREYFPKRVTINESITHAGTVCAIIIIGILAQLYSHNWIVYGTIILAILSLVPLLFINPNEINYSVARELPISESPANFLQLAKSRSIYIFFSAVIIFHLANAAQLPLIIQEFAKIKPDQASIFMATCIVLAQIVMIIVAFSMGFVINKIGRKPIFLFAFIFLILRATLFSTTENPYYLLLIQMLDGVSIATFNVVAVVMVSDLASGTGRFNFLLGILGLCTGIGSSISNAAAGYITKIHGFHVGFLSLASVATIGLFIYMMILPETKKQYGSPY